MRNLMRNMMLAVLVAVAMMAPGLWSSGTCSAEESAKADTSSKVETAVSADDQDEESDSDENADNDYLGDSDISSKLPKTVLDVVKARYPQAAVAAASIYAEGGVIYWDLSVIPDGKFDENIYEKVVEITVSDDGKNFTEDKTIDATALPKAVMDGIRAKYPLAGIEEEAYVCEENGNAEYTVIITTKDEIIQLILDKTGKITEETSMEEEDIDSEEDGADDSDAEDDADAGTTGK